MTGEVMVHGIVLSSMPVGEFDRRITILTAENGRISAFVRGARRPTSAFSACTQGFTYGEFYLYEGRDSYNLMRVENANYFESLRSDLDGMYYGMYFCELIGYLTREGADEADQMKLLYIALLALSKGVIPRRLLRCIVELRALAQYGEAPVAEGCFYSAKRNGLVSDNDVTQADFTVSGTTLYTVRYIITRPLRELTSFTVKDEVLCELERVCRDFTARHIDRQLKSVEMLDT